MAPDQAQRSGHLNGCEAGQRPGETTVRGDASAK
jgi:hypothetical protein